MIFYDSDEIETSPLMSDPFLKNLGKTEPYNKGEIYHKNVLNQYTYIFPESLHAQ